MSNNSTNSKGWEHPNGPPNVWKKVEVDEKLSDGSVKRICVSIQDVLNDRERREEAIQIMINDFIKYEPMCISLGLNDDKQAIEDFRLVWDFCLDQGICVGAYKLGENGELLNLIGTNFLFVSTEDSEKIIIDLMSRFKSPGALKIFRVMGDLSKKAEPDFQQLCGGKTHYISALGLVVSPRYRGQKLGVELLKARDNIGQKHKIPATLTTFTAISSQIQAERANFTSLLDTEYKNVVDESGKEEFPGITAKNVRVMARKIDLNNR